MADVWANSMACHPRATYHIVGCCHLANSMLWSQSYVSHCRVLPLGEFTVMIPEPHATLQGAATGRIQWHVIPSHVSHCRVLPLGGFTLMIPEPHCRVQSLAKSMSWSCHIAGCKNSIRHIENCFSTYFILFCFLMQLGLWRAAAFVSFPTLLL